jgi:hypothetical protein
LALQARWFPRLMALLDSSRLLVSSFTLRHDG